MHFQGCFYAKIYLIDQIFDKRPDNGKFKNILKYQYIQ